MTTHVTDDDVFAEMPDNWDSEMPEPIPEPETEEESFPVVVHERAKTDDTSKLELENLYARVLDEFRQIVEAHESGGYSKDRIRGAFESLIGKLVTKKSELEDNEHAFHLIDRMLVIARMCRRGCRRYYSDRDFYYEDEYRKLKEAYMELYGQLQDEEWREIPRAERLIKESIQDRPNFEAGIVKVVMEYYTGPSSILIQAMTVVD